MLEKNGVFTIEVLSGVCNTNGPEFFKIQPGLWALEESRESVLKKFQLEGFDSPAPDEAMAERQQEFNHSYYQGLIVKIGNMKKMNTFVSCTDQKRLFLGKPLKEIATLETIHDFTYPEYLKKAKMIDVIWFNERRLRIQVRADFRR